MYIRQFETREAQVTNGFKDGLENHLGYRSLPRYSGASSTKHLGSKIPPLLLIQSLLPENTLLPIHGLSQVSPQIAPGVLWFNGNTIMSIYFTGSCLTFKARGPKNHDHHWSFKHGKFPMLRQKSASHLLNEYH